MILRDASPLIALINQSDINHTRCVSALSSLPASLVTTWSCFTEAMYLLVGMAVSQHSRSYGVT